jgi:hypothetical protein
MQSNRIADGVLCALGFSLGCFITALTILVAVDTGFAAQLSELSCRPNLLKDYGDIISGVLALVGGSLAVWKINDQINQADRHKNEDRERSDYSARAVLPNALRQILDYAQGTVDLTIHMHRSNEEVLKLILASSTKEPWQRPAPEFPDYAVSILRDNILYAEDPIRRMLAKIIVELQIQNSRLVDVYENFLPAATFDLTKFNMLMRDAVKLYALTDELLPYARREPDYQPDEVTTLDIESAVNNLTRKEPGFREAVSRACKHLCATAGRAETVG